MRLNLLLLLAIAAACPVALAQEFDVPGSGSWLDTKVDVRAQDEISITASGSLTIANAAVTAAGTRRGFRDLLRSYPVNTAGQGALIARLGDSAAAQAFLIGTELKWTAPRPGRLFLGINKTGTDAPKGSFKVTVKFSKRGPEKITQDYKLPAVTVASVDQYPRRITDAQGNLGDNANFLVVGTEAQVLKAFQLAGWVEVDRSRESAIKTGIEAVLNKQAYLRLPMSELMLFGRVQDHGMAQAEPLAVVAERHHFRIWKAPFKVDGAEVVVGAGTHDIGFDRDARNNGVTHKIDPDVDKERDYIGKSLEESGMVAKLDYVMPSKPSREAVTATGATFKSDGRVLVIYLVPEAGKGVAPETGKGVTPAVPATPTPAATPGNSSSIFDGVVNQR
ncbi:MAG: LssY C-terminal domain-containing protein [Acidobacteriota bacterium]